jgi:hypothetical protein
MVVIEPAIDRPVCSRVALERTRVLANVIAGLPTELLDGFQSQFNFVLEQRRIQAEMEQQSMPRLRLRRRNVRSEENNEMEQKAPKRREGS